MDTGRSMRRRAAEREAASSSFRFRVHHQVILSIHYHVLTYGSVIGSVSCKGNISCPYSITCFILLEIEFYDV